MFLFPRTQTDSLTQLQSIHDNSGSVQPCVLDDVSRGMTLLNFTMGTESHGYITTVTVGDGKKESNFTQLIQVRPGDPPAISLQYVHNTSITKIT